MSEFTIKDGSGNGYRAQVDKDFRLRSQAAAVAEDTFVSVKRGLSFILTAHDNTLALANTEYPILWFRNDDPNRLFLLNRFSMGWNGGNVNHNRVAHIHIYFQASVPSANNTALTPTNLNGSATQLALATSYLWDGVGNGMTIATLGTLIYCPLIDRGSTLVNIDGSAILGYGQSFAVTVEGEEAGLASISITGWYASEEEI